ncbi:MAG: hypothetical protein AAF517_11940, partial [Planctomycetota bacterium]
LVFQYVAPVTVLAAVSYGALYLTIGVFFLKRAMVIAVAFTLLVEAALSLVPAIVHELAVGLHLRTVLLSNMVGAENVKAGLVVSDLSSAAQIPFLAGYTATLLLISSWVLTRRQLVLAER